MATILVEMKCNFVMSYPIHFRWFFTRLYSYCEGLIVVICKYKVELLSFISELYMLILVLKIFDIYTNTSYKRKLIKMIKKDNHQIRNKSVLFIFIIFLVAIIIVLFVVNTVAKDGLEKIENNNASIQMTRVENALSFTLDSMSNSVQDWSTWTDSYDYVAGNYPGYVDDNLYLDAFETLNIGVVIFYAADGEIMYQNDFNFELRTEDLPSSDFTSEMNKLQIDQNKDIEFHVSGMITTSEGVYAIVSSPILRSDGTGENFGNLVFGRLIDADEITYLEEKIGLSFEFKENNSLLSNTTMSIDSIDGNQVVISRILVDLSGNNDVILEVVIPSDYRNLVNGAIINMFIALAISSLMYTLIIVVYMNRAVFSPLIGLTNDIRDITFEKGLKRRLPQKNKVDEISYITNNVNSMLEVIHKNEIEIMHLANTDVLTKIPNRRYIFQCIEKSARLCQREQCELSIIMIDIDDFKMFNDSYGHLVGDKVLFKIAQSIKDSLLRPYDEVGRFGGEEFIVSLPQTDYDSALLIAEKIRIKVLDLKIEEIKSNSNTSITISLGVATGIPSKKLSYESIINEADKALLNSKDTGKNKVTGRKS